MTYAGAESGQEGKVMRKMELLAGLSVIALGIIIAGVGLPYLHQTAPGGTCGSRRKLFVLYE